MFIDRRKAEFVETIYTMHFRDDGTVFATTMAGPNHSKTFYHITEILTFLSRLRHIRLEPLTTDKRDKQL